MRRAVVLIGVSRTGDLPKLLAVHEGVRRMHDWARLQGIPETAIRTLSDEAGGEVRLHQIEDAIGDLIAPGTIEQLIVYFSGHGIHNGGDYWLLSRAPKSATEAVNVEASMQLARYCGLDHVVMISDCCRTAPEGIRAQSVSGGSIFPNDPVDGLERAVDAFFACARGKPSFEIRDREESARSYRAVYTEVLSEALCGKALAALDLAVANGQPVALVNPWRLSDFLQREVPRRIHTMQGRQPTVNQTPIARINSRDRWISRISPAPAGLARPDEPVATGASAGTGASFGIDTDMSQLVRTLASDAGSMLSGTFARAPVFGPITGAQEFDYRRGMFVQTFGPARFETQCGFKLSGQGVRAVHGTPDFEVLGAARDLVRLGSITRPVCILLELDDGAGVCVPALPEWIGELRFDEDGELTHIAYEPSQFTQRWWAMEPFAQPLREFRATVSASVNRGVFRLQEHTVEHFMNGIRTSSSVDLVLALYGAYALHDLGLRGRIRAMSAELIGDLGFAPFDLSLLAADQGVARSRRDGTLAPPFPLLTQGWALLSAFKAELDSDLMNLRSHLRQSVWTVFEPDGTQRLIRRIARRGGLE